MEEIFKMLASSFGAIQASDINRLMDAVKENATNLDRGDISDGYHTFKELYEFRKVYNAALFNEWAIQKKYEVHKSVRHHDGELCFGGDWFVVIAILPEGQITNHYHIKDWDLFFIPEEKKAIYPFDDHTPTDVLDRLKALLFI